MMSSQCPGTRGATGVETQIQRADARAEPPPRGGQRLRWNRRRLAPSRHAGAPPLEPHFPGHPVLVPGEPLGEPRQAPTDLAPLLPTGGSPPRAQLTGPIRGPLWRTLQPARGEAVSWDEDGLTALAQRAEAPQRQPTSVRQRDGVRALTFHPLGPRVADQAATHEKVSLRAAHVLPEAPHGDVEQTVRVPEDVLRKNRWSFGE